MSRGTVGTSCGTVMVLSKKEPRPADCKQCRNGSCMDGKIYCNITGSLKPVNKKVCRYYQGSYIDWSEVKKSKQPRRNKKNRKKRK